MGYVPTHRTSCIKVYSFPLKCRYCRSTVIYFECSCGSKVYLDPPDDGLHDCGRAIRADRAMLLMDLIEISHFDPGSQTECPMCGIKVLNAKDRIRKHFKKCPKREVWFSR